MKPEGDLIGAGPVDQPETLGAVRTRAGNYIHVDSEDYQQYWVTGELEPTTVFIATSGDVLVSLSEVR